MTDDDQPDLFPNDPTPKGVGDLGGRYDLYGGTPPHEPVDTSLAAAKEIEPKVNKLQRKVLQAIIDSGERGTTDEELVDWLDMNPSTLRPRRRELYLKKYISYRRDDAGEPTKRPMRSGRLAHVYISAVEMGR